MSNKIAWRYVWQVACALAIVGCEDDVADYGKPKPPCECEEGQVCDKAGICGAEEDLCGKFFCIDGEICEENQCVNACERINCPTGKTCYLAECIDDACLDENKVKKDCGPDMMCSKGECVKDGCIKDGKPVTCETGFKCVMGTCTEIACIDVNCKEGRSCSGGKCIDNGCVGKECPEGMICSLGECIYPQCLGKTCNYGKICKVDGECDYEDKPGLVFNPFQEETEGDSQKGNATSEDGKSINIPLSLNNQPSAEVRLKCLIDVEKITEAKVDCTDIVFTPEDWDSMHDIIITGLPDNVVDGDQDYQVTFITESDDKEFDGITLTIDMVNIDKDTASLLIVHPESAITSEDGTSVEYKVSLTSRPSQNVTVEIGIVNENKARDPEASTSPTTLTFTPENWDVPQTVIVTGNDDGNEQTGSHIYYLVFGNTKSEDPHFNDIATPQIELTNLDNDSAALIATPSSVTTDEKGTNETIDIALTVEPTADVVVTVTISKPEEATTETKEFTIPKAEWNKPVSVVIAGVADHVIDGDQSYEVVLTTKSEDQNYNHTKTVIEGINQDMDKAGFTYVYRTSPEVHESTASKTEVEVALTSKPSSTVTIKAVVMDDTELALEVAELTIEPEDWNKPHVLTVTGVSDNTVDGDQTTKIRLIASSEDENFDGHIEEEISIKTIDDDNAKIVVISPATVLPENSGTGAFTIQLSSKPQAPVTINMETTDLTELRIDGPTSITIQPEGWDKTVTVNFAAVDDKLTDGTQTAKINIKTSSEDKEFNNIETSTTMFSITDDEQANIVLAAASNELKPGAYETTITARLSYEPTDTVIVTLTTGDDNMAHLATTTLTFTPENWNQGQVVAVTTENMSSAESAVSTVQIYGTGSSNCNAYNGIKSNVLDFSIYAYGKQEYTTQNGGGGDGGGNKRIIAYDTLLPGVYKLQVWGASGGDQVGFDQTKGSHAGLGGYAEGILTLNEKTDIVVHVGGQGKLGTTAYGVNAVGGGCNGGGGGTSSQKTGAAGFGGGGASDIRIGGDTYYHRVIVAGGGGGAEDGLASTAGTLNGENDGSGGYGGGSEGGYGYSDGVQKYAPATQTTGYSFGVGQPAGSNQYTSDTGGGGGGWFGGYCGNDHNSGGSGGSGYVFTSTSSIVKDYKLDKRYQLTSTRLVAGNGSFPSTSGNSEETGHKGDGFVRIKLINYQ